MLVVNGTVEMQSDITSAQMAELARLAELVRSRHGGNHEYRFSVDVDNAKRLRLTERWDGLSDFLVHGQTPEVEEIGAFLAPIMAAAPQLTRYEVASAVDF